MKRILALAVIDISLLGIGVAAVSAGTCAPCTAAINAAIFGHFPRLADT